MGTPGQRRRYRAMQLEIARALESDPDPDGSRRAAKEKRLEEGLQTGNTTLCCRNFECNCGQNLRLVNGVATPMLGTMMPGSEYDHFMQQIHKDAEARRAQGYVTRSLRAEAESHWATAGADAVTNVEKADDRQGGSRSEVSPRHEQNAQVVWQNSRMQALREWAGQVIEAEGISVNEQTRRFATDFLAAVTWTHQQNSTLPWWQLVTMVTSLFKSDRVNFFDVSIRKLYATPPSTDRDFAWGVLTAGASNGQELIMPMSIAMVAMLRSAGVKLPGQPEG